MVNKMVKKLDIGCGNKKVKDAIGLDINKHEGVDIVADMNKRLPFVENEFDIIYMNNSLEHCKDVEFTLKEVHRILKDNGKVFIKVPYWKNPNAFSFNNHFYFTYHSLDKPPSDKLFKIKKRIVFYCDKKLLQSLTFPLELIVNLFPNVYEWIFSSIIPAPNMRFELTK